MDDFEKKIEYDILHALDRIRAYEYNKAIDDFVTEIKTIQDQDEPLYNILWDEIAEKLKAGGTSGIDNQ